MVPTGNRRLTIVMYHYVRELEKTRFPEIKGLHTHLFAEQVAYFQKHYDPISGHELIGAIRGERELPARALLLTFDDGYRDHFTDVLPVLREAGLKGCFFPPSGCISEHRVLDVNKIHFTLASVEDKARLAHDLMERIDALGAKDGVEPASHYWDTWAKASRWDPAEVVFVKRTLQRGLPEAARARIVDDLFSAFVTSDESAFAQELYMNPSELRELLAAGHLVGSHGHAHYWLDSLSASDQAADMDRSLAFLAELGVPPTETVVCYPYGGYDEKLLSLLRDRGCPAGVTTEVRLADLDSDDPLALPRIDTNDLPRDRDASPGAWTEKA